MIKRLAIIPARSGSKRIKNKNIKNFNGKPLIFYTLNALKKSKLFSKIHVSTDSPKIKTTVQKIGIKVDFLRKKNISKDNTPVSKVIKFVLKEYKKINEKFDEIWLVYATNPLIRNEYLKKANKIYLNNKGKYSIISVAKYNYPNEWALKLNKKNKTLSPLFPKLIKKDSKKFSKKFCDAGMFVIYQKNFEKKLVQLKYLPFELPIWSSVDIDDMDDFNLARKFFQISK